MADPTGPATGTKDPVHAPCPARHAARHGQGDCIWRFTPVVCATPWPDAMTGTT
ncbi:hypothetical protein RAA17_09995 [Komagataeibacter rhaeticus]|nr:hypothetical protein [Komagataeibacter rhaeticus]